MHSSFVRSWREQCHRIRLWSRYHGHALIRLNKRNLWFLTFIFGWSLLLESFLDIYFLAETNLGHAMSPEAKKIADYRFDSIGCRLQSIQCLVFIPFQFVLFFVSVNFISFFFMFNGSLSVAMNQMSAEFQRLRRSRASASKLAKHKFQRKQSELAKRHFVQSRR